jgi:hypothetical protein
MGVAYSPRTAFLRGIDDLVLQSRVLSGSDQQWTSTGELPAAIQISLLILFDLFIDHPPGNLKHSSDERKRRRMLEAAPQNAACVDVLFQTVAAALEVPVSL